MKRLVYLCILICLTGVCHAATLEAQNTSCDQFRAKVPDIAALMKMTKAERDDLKQFVIAHDADLKACLGHRLERLKAFLK